MEGGPGGSDLDWCGFWKGMLAATALVIAAISIGVHFGWLN